MPLNTDAAGGNGDDHRDTDAQDASGVPNQRPINPMAVMQSAMMNMADQNAILSQQMVDQNAILTQ